MKIFLIGMPGSGKSTMGKVLAERMSVTYVDLDAEIERKEGLTIKEIFEKAGEPYFRQAEAAVLREVSARQASFVMATGGGTPCFYEGIEFMNVHGITVFLDVPPDVLFARLKEENTEHRPMFQKNLYTDETVRQLHANRIKFYKQATYCITNTDVKEVLDLLSIRTKTLR